MENQTKITIGVIAAIVLVVVARIFFHIPITVSLTVLIALAALRYLPGLIGPRASSAVITVVVLILLYSTVCWWAERSFPFSTRVKPFGIQSLDNTIASWINRPGVRGEQKLLDSLFSKEEQADPAEIKKSFKEDPLEAARLLSQQQADGQVIRDMTNPFKKPVDIARYRLQRAEKNLRDRDLIIQALAKEAKAVQIKGTVTKKLVGKDERGEEVTVFEVGDRVALARVTPYLKEAELMIVVRKGNQETFMGDGQKWSIPYSCVKFDPTEPEVVKKETSTPAPAVICPKGVKLAKSDGFELVESNEKNITIKLKTSRPVKVLDYWDKNIPIVMSAWSEKYEAVGNKLQFSTNGTKFAEFVPGVEMHPYGSVLVVKGTPGSIVVLNPTA